MLPPKNLTLPQILHFFMCRNFPDITDTKSYQRWNKAKERKMNQWCKKHKLDPTEDFIIFDEEGFFDEIDNKYLMKEKDISPKMDKIHPDRISPTYLKRMEKMRLKELIKLLPDLSNSDLLKLEEAIEIEINVARAENMGDKENKEFILFYNTIISEINSDMKKRYASPNACRSRSLPTYKKLHNLFIEFTAWVEKVTEKRLKPIEWLRAYSLLHKIVMLNLRHKNIPLSLRTWILSANYFPELFNQQFPDYIACGMGSMIFLYNKENQKKENENES